MEKLLQKIIEVQMFELREENWMNKLTQLNMFLNATQDSPIYLKYRLICNYSPDLQLMSHSSPTKSKSYSTQIEPVVD